MLHYRLRILSGVHPGFMVSYECLASGSSEPTVSRYLQPYRWRPSSQTWRSFVQNHLNQGHEFRRCVDALELQEVVSARGSPWQNSYCERVIGTIRRECTDRIIATNEDQLQRVIDAYVRYYNDTRTHLSLAKRTPDGRRTPTKHRGRVVAKAQVCGLHHRYDRLAA